MMARSTDAHTGAGHLHTDHLRRTNSVSESTFRRDTDGLVMDEDDWEGEDEDLVEWKFKDTYTELARLSSGTEGECTKVRSTTTGEIFVAKHIKSSRIATGYKGLEAIILIHDLDPHPNLVKLFGAEEAPDDRIKLYFELCDAGDLSKQIDHMWNVGPRQFDMKICPEVFALHCFFQLLEALAYIHYGFRYEGNGEYSQSAGHTSIVHADLKPQNVLLRWNASANNECGMPDVVLADFGLSVYAHKSKGYAGSSKYMAPEVHYLYKLKISGSPDFARRMNDHVLTPKSDMWSLGATMF